MGIQLQDNIADTSSLTRRHLGVYILYPTKRFVTTGPPVKFFDRPFVRSDGRTQNFQTDEKKSDEKISGENFVRQNLFDENFLDEKIGAV